MGNIFAFGERVDGYAVPVLNERAVRAAAGIVFFFAIVSFMNAWLIGNFQPTRVFVVAFLIDFTLRIFVNPRYAPSMILGCKIYNRFHKDQAQLCPGGVCVVEPAPGAGGNLAHAAVVLVFAGVMVAWAVWVSGNDPYVRKAQPGVESAAAPQAPVDPAEAERCKVPDFAKAMGHVEQWKLHNNCK
jgi:hypothetical protein